MSKALPRKFNTIVWRSVERGQEKREGGMGGTNSSSAHVEARGICHRTHSELGGSGLPTPPPQQCMGGEQEKYLEERGACEGQGVKAERRARGGASDFIGRVETRKGPMPKKERSTPRLKYAGGMDRLYV